MNTIRYALPKMSPNITIDSIDTHGACDGLLASHAGFKQERSQFVF